MDDHLEWKLRGHFGQINISSWEQKYHNPHHFFVAKLIVVTLLSVILLNNAMLYIKKCGRKWSHWEQEEEFWISLFYSCPLPQFDNCPTKIWYKNMNTCKLSNELRCIMHFVIINVAKMQPLRQLFLSTTLVFDDN